jgi:hypothetical protein
MGKNKDAPTKIPWHFNIFLYGYQLIANELKKLCTDNK